MYSETGRGFPGAICVYKSLCQEYQSKIDRRRFTVFNEFFFATFMTHYRLYQMVTSGCPPRHQSTGSLKLPVIQPPKSFTPLIDGKEPDIFEYETKIKELDDIKVSLQQARDREQRAVTEKDAERIAQIQSSCSDQLGSYFTQKVSCLLCFLS